MTFRFKLKAIVLAIFLSASAALAGEADVLNVVITATGVDVYRFDVTVSHADEGWDHYANAFEILDSEGNILGVRTLLHPHVNEQPFTRSLGNVRIRAGVTKIIVRAVDSVHLTGGEQIELDWPLTEK